MAGDPRTKIVISTERLNNARREELLRQFNELQAAIGCERPKTHVRKKGKTLERVDSMGKGLRGLDDDDVSCQQSGCHLSSCYQEGEIPGNDGGSDAQRRVSGEDCVLLIVFDDFFGKLDGGHAPEPGNSGTCFDICLRDLESMKLLVTLL